MLDQFENQRGRDGDKAVDRVVDDLEFIIGFQNLTFTMGGGKISKD